MCPWQDWSPATLRFCEEMLCGSVRQPANTFSNIAFIFVGILILGKQKKWNPFSLMGIASVAIGISSGIYHASMTYFWQFFDVSSMFMLILLALTFNLVRGKILPRKLFTKAYLSMLFFSMVTMFFLQGQSGEWIFASQVVILILTEIKILRQGEKASYKFFIKAICVFFLAFLIWVGDIQGWWCDPSNHILQGHAIWHILNACVIWLLYCFYKTFEEKLV
jgi:hypothetical protein